MLVERFESRSVMAGDAFHNFVYPEDTDSNGAVTPLDALVVINRLNESSPGSASGESAASSTRLSDVNADAAVTPIDALVVINLLNSQNPTGPSGRRASNVDVERRMERIEQAIASNNLPPGLSIDQARTILETLRSGGRPELGDFVLDGSIRWKGSRESSAANPAVSMEGGTGDASDTNQLERLEWLIGAVAGRLGAFGVSATVIDTLAAEMRAAHQAGKPLDMSQIRDRLSALGVDVAKILPQPAVPSQPPLAERPAPPTRPDQPSRPDQPARPGQPDRPDVPGPPEGADQPVMPTIMVTPPIAESIVARMQAAGIAEPVIATIRGAMWSAINVDRPLDLQQVRARLAELGVPWERLEAPPVTTLPVPPSPPGRPDQRVRPDQPDRPDVPGPPAGTDQPVVPAIMVTEPVATSLIARLRAAGVGDPILETLSQEIWSAIEAGRPLDMLRVRTRLQELLGS